MERIISGIIDKVIITDDDIILRYSNFWIIMVDKKELIGNKIPIVGDMVSCTRQGSQIEKIFVNNKMIVDRSSKKE